MELETGQFGQGIQGSLLGRMVLGVQVGTFLLVPQIPFNLPFLPEEGQSEAF